MSVKEKALQQALRTLEALGCQYKVITAEGEEHGALQVQRQKPARTRTLRHPPGTFKNYLAPHMEPMKVGDVAVIPSGEFAPTELQGAVTSLACNRWGKGSYMTTVKGSTVELLRIA